MISARSVLHVAIVATLPLAGCTLASDLDRFERAELCSVELALTGFQFHAPMGAGSGHEMVFRLVKPAEAPGGTPSLRGLAILANMPAPGIALSLPNAVRADDGPFDVDFFADVDANGTFSPSVGAGTGTDHSWVLEDVCGAPRVSFVHDTFFESFDEPVTNTGDLEVAFANMPTGGALEVQLVQRAPADAVEDEPDRTIGLYRLDAVVEPGFSIALPGLVDPDPSVEYELRIWTDADGDAAYDLGVDHSWIVLADGAELAAPLDFDFGLRDANREDIERILVTIAP